MINQELAEGQCLKSWKVERCKCLILGFENDGLQKKSHLLGWKMCQSKLRIIKQLLQ